MGLNHQFKPDNATPALLGFAEIALSERMRNDSASFKSAMFGLTTYKAIDPVVFSLTAGYRFNQTRKELGGEKHAPHGCFGLLFRGLLLCCSFY